MTVTSKPTNLNMITLAVNVFEHNASRTASRSTSRIWHILTTLKYSWNGTTEKRDYS